MLFREDLVQLQKNGRKRKKVVILMMDPNEDMNKVK